MAAITLNHAESSNIASASYDVEARELVVVFRNGGTYIYEGVSPDVAKSFEDAPSPGKFLHSSIKGQYDFRKA